MTTSTMVATTTSKTISFLQNPTEGMGMTAVNPILEFQTMTDVLMMEKDDGNGDNWQ